jgi:hypothetical protein
MSLQMGWVESPGYLCVASEKARDVAEDYINVPVGQLPSHKFQEHTEVHPDFQSLPACDKISQPLLYMVEVYVGDFICIAIPTSQEQLRHVSTAIITGIHDVFPPSDADELDAILFKKVVKGKGQWAMQKDILGFEFDRTPDTHTVWLEETKRNKLLTILQGWLRGSRDGNHGFFFEELESVAQKIRHAFTAIPAGKGLLSPLNAVVAAKPRFVFLHRNQDLFEAVSECRILLRESIAAHTCCTKLVSKWPDFIGIVDASGQGVGGIVVGERVECVPTVFQMEWPDDVKKDMKSESNPEGHITNSDLEMAGLLLLWLVMEEVCGPRKTRGVVQ